MKRRKELLKVLVLLVIPFSPVWKRGSLPHKVFINFLTFLISSWHTRLIKAATRNQGGLGRWASLTDCTHPKCTIITQAYFGSKMARIRFNFYKLQMATKHLAYLSSILFSQIIDDLAKNRNDFGVQKIENKKQILLPSHYVRFSQFWSHFRGTNALFASKAKINVDFSL